MKRMNNYYNFKIKYLNRDKNMNQKYNKFLKKIKSNLNKFKIMMQIIKYYRSVYSN